MTDNLSPSDVPEVSATSGTSGASPASDTPNVVLQNPAIRKGLNWVVGMAAIVVPLAIVIDGASADFDWASWTTPAAAGTSFLAGLLGVVVTIPNIPKK